MSIFHSLFEHAVTAIDDLFVDYLPSKTLRDMHPYIFYPVGIFVLGCMFAFFLLILIPGYQSQIAQTYLSPSDSADSKLCDHVEVSQSGKYLASREGYWEGDPNFSYSTAIFVLKVENMKISREKYSTYLDYFQAAMAYLGEDISPNYDLAVNLLIWMAYVIPEPGIISNRFYLNANPSVVFDRRFTTGSLTNARGDCVSPLRADFDPSGGIISLSIDMEKYLNDPVCMDIAKPSTLGFNSISSGSNFDINFDIRSLIIAVAVNINLLQFDQLQLIGSINSDTISLSSAFSTTDAITIPSGWYIDPRYSGMRPILCTAFTEETHTNFCLMKVGNAYALPIFNHRGASLFYPVVCDCHGSAKDYVHDPLFDCNVFEFLSGFLFFDTVEAAPLFALLQQVPPAESQYFSFFPMYAGSIYANRKYAELSDVAYREAAYSFCNLTASSIVINGSDSTCRFLTFASFDNIMVSSPPEYDPNVNVNDTRYPRRTLDTTRYAVTSFYTPILTGACQSSVVVPPESWERLSLVPFALLEERFDVCRNDRIQAMSDNLGIASGTVALVFPFWLLLFSAIVTMFQHLTGKKITKAYSERERSEVLETLAIMILHERDRREEENEEKAAAAAAATEKKGILAGLSLRFKPLDTTNNNNASATKKSNTPTNANASPSKVKRRARTKRRFVTVSALAEDVLTLMEKQDKEAHAAIFFPKEFENNNNSNNNNASGSVDYSLMASSAGASLRNSFLATALFQSLKRSADQEKESSKSAISAAKGRANNNTIDDEKSNLQDEAAAEKPRKFSISSLLQFSKEINLGQTDDKSMPKCAPTMAGVRSAKVHVLTQNPDACVNSVSRHCNIDIEQPLDRHTVKKDVDMVVAFDTNHEDDDNQKNHDPKQTINSLATTFHDTTNNLNITSMKNHGSHKKSRIVLNDSSSLGLTASSLVLSNTQTNPSVAEASAAVTARETWQRFWCDSMRYLDALEGLLLRLFASCKEQYEYRNNNSNNNNDTMVRKHANAPRSFSMDPLYPIIMQMFEALQLKKYRILLDELPAELLLSSTMSASLLLLRRIFVTKLTQVCLLHVAVIEENLTYHHYNHSYAQDKAFLNSDSNTTDNIWHAIVTSVFSKEGTTVIAKSANTNTVTSSSLLSSSTIEEYAQFTAPQRMYLQVLSSREEDDQESNSKTGSPVFCYDVGHRLMSFSDLHEVWSSKSLPSLTNEKQL